MANQMPIPTDWNEETDGYALYMVCGPNSDQWRRNVRGAIYALTRGRNYDFTTGIFKDIEQIANDLQDSFMSCQLEDIFLELKNITRTQRMLVASIVGDAINFDEEPNLPNAINYEGLYSILKEQNTILDDGMTLEEMQELIEGLDLTGSSFLDDLTDIAQILSFLVLLWGPTQKVSVAFGWWDKFTYKRYQHNSLSIEAHKATSLRGIMRGLTPFTEEQEEEESLSWRDIMAIPFLGKAVIALVEPSPIGEIGLIAATLGGKIASLYQQVKEVWLTWYSKWLNLVEEPDPIDTVTGALGVIANKISTREDASENPSVSVTNRLDIIAQALQELQISDPSSILTLIATAITNLDGSPTTSEWQVLIDQITLKMGESMPIINVSCGSCGSSGGCGCGSGAGSGAYGPGTQGPGDVPPTVLPPAGYPGTFPDGDTYNIYKCKAANVLIVNLAEILYQIGIKENINLSQYTTHEAAGHALGIEVTLTLSSGGTLPPGLSGWLTERILEFLLPYPSESAVGLAIFEGIRLDLLVDREDAVCELYNASSTDTARNALEERLDGYIDATSYTADVKASAKEMYKAVLTNSFLGRLFEKDSAINVYSDSSSIDCSECEGIGGYTIVIGEALSSPGAEPFTVGLIYSTFSGICGPTLKRGIVVNFHAEVTIDNITGVEGEANCTGLSHKYFLYPAEGAAGGAIYSSNTPPMGISGVRSLAIITGSGGTPEATIAFTPD